MEDVWIEVVSYIKNVEKIENCIINPKSEMENKQIDPQGGDDRNFNLNFYMIPRKIELPFYSFFVKIPGNSRLNQTVSKLCISQKSFTVATDSQPQDKLVSFLELQMSPNSYLAFMDVNQKQVFFAQMQDKGNGVVLKIRTNSQDVMEKFEEIFEE